MKRFLLAFGALLFLTAYAEAATLFAVCTTACTWNNVSTAMWSASSGGATGQPPPVAGDTVNFDAATCVGGTTCTTTVAANVAMTNLTMGACTASTTGCVLDFSANNNNITISGIFNNSGSGTRRLNMGNGTWTMTNNTSTPWVMSTVTNLTFNANSSTILFTTSASARTFSSANVTYSTIQLADQTSAPTGSPVFQFSNATFTVANLIVGKGQELKFTAGGSYTISTAFTVTGGGASSVVFIDGQQNTIVNNGVVSMAWAAIRDLTFTVNTNGIANNSFNAGNVIGLTVNAPGGGSCIIGGWLLWRDMPEHLNDNFPAWLEKVG